MKKKSAPGVRGIDPQRVPGPGPGLQDRAGDRADQRAGKGHGLPRFSGFLRPAQKKIADTIKELQRLGVSLKIITGDNELAAGYVAHQIGIANPRIVTGNDLRRMSSEAAHPPDRRDRHLRGGRTEPERKDHHLPEEIRATWSATSATGSTTPPPCTPPMSASRWRARLTWPKKRPISSCWKKTWRY